MDQIEIKETLTVSNSPDAVVIWSTEACDAGGETFPFEVHLVLMPEDAVKFANAILHAAANLPEEDFSDVPDDLLADDGALKSSVPA